MNFFKNSLKALPFKSRNEIDKTANLCVSAQSKMSSRKMNYPSADRNKGPILEVLKKHLRTEGAGKVLELASGTGQHCAYFGAHFPNLEFQPSDLEQSLFDSIMAYADDTPTKNVRYPIRLDVSGTDWKLNELFDYILCVNLIHVSPIECSVGLFRNGSKVMKPGGLIITYGAYAYKGVIEPQSNIDFDRSIRSQQPKWGLRDIVDLENIAKEYKIVLKHKYDMPSNNKCLIWEKQN